MYDNFSIFESPGYKVELLLMIIEFQILFHNQAHLREVGFDLDVRVLGLTFKLLTKAHSF